MRLALGVILAAGGAAGAVLLIAGVVLVLCHSVAWGVHRIAGGG